MALFTPVDERRFAFDKTVGRCHSEAVVVKAFFDYRIYVLQPLPVAGHFIQFVGCDSPDFPVGAYWPGAAAAGILNYYPSGSHLLHQRYSGGFGLHGGHGEQY